MIGRILFYCDARHYGFIKSGSREVYFGGNAVRFSPEMIIPGLPVYFRYKRGKNGRVATDIKTMIGSDDLKMKEGTIKMYAKNRGFGFVTDDQGNDFFFHVKDHEGPESELVTGAIVIFNAGENDKGLVAKNVAVAKGEDQ